MRHTGHKGSQFSTVNLTTRIWRFYRDGFRGMGPLGRSLWLLILIKLVIMFVVLRLLFFQPALGGLSDDEKADRVARELTLPE